MKKNWIISANYKKHQSPFKWLVRHDGQPVSTARAFKNVIGENVLVKNASVEYQFSCHIVMAAEFVICTNAETGHDFNSKTQIPEEFKLEPEILETKLRYDGDGFISTNGNKRVFGGESIHLSSDEIVMKKPFFASPPIVTVPVDEKAEDAAAWQVVGDRIRHENAARGLPRKKSLLPAP